MVEKKQVALRLDPIIIEQIKIKADQEHRSVNNLIEWLIIQYLNNEKWTMNNEH